MDRRTLLASAGAVGVAGMAGCLDDLTEHEASAYGVREATAADAGYEPSGVDAVVIEEPVGIGPLRETVVATNYVVEYEKTVSVPVLGERRAGVFVTFATPQVSVFGREFNPVADMDTEELVELVQDSYDGLEGITHDEDDEVEVLGETAIRSRFEAEATFDGTSVDVDVHVTEAVATDDDLVVTVGVYPNALRSQEERHTLAMMGGVDPDAASTADANGAGSGDDDGSSGSDGDNDGDDGGGDSSDGDDDDNDDDDDDGLLP